MVDYVKYCREQADDTFYDPLKESWTMVGDHIEKLEKALRGVIAVADRDAPEFRFAREVLSSGPGETPAS